MRLTPLVTVTLAVGSIAACASSGSGASAPPPPVVTPSTQAAAPSVPPPVPAPSTPATAEGAIAFVRAFVGEEQRATVTNDVTALLTYSSASCNCRKLVRDIEGRRANGVHFTSTARTIDRITIGLQIPNRLDVIVASHWPRNDEVNSDNHVVATDPGHSAKERFSVQRKGDRWLITDVVGEYRSTS